MELVAERPFPLMMTGNCLPHYEELASTRPHWKLIAGKNRENNKRIDVGASEALKMDIAPVWREFITYHTSQEFYGVLLQHFREHFQREYPKVNFDTLKVGMRNKDYADIYLDCLISINTPVITKSTVSKPHLDHPKELWAALLYMKEPDDNAGGDLVIYDCPNPEVRGKRQVSNAVKEVITIPYAANTMVCFMNTPNAVHAVTEREVTDKPRLMVNFVLEFA